MPVTIRESTPADHAALFDLYPRAFPDEDLLELVRDLLAAPEAQSLVAQQGGDVIGHIGFTDVSVPGADAPLSMLAPLAVAPDHQRQGVGKALIADGVDRLRKRDIAKVLVLGDPNYYSRSGFAQEMAITPPHPIPQDWMPAWQSMPLGGADIVGNGMLHVPAFWDRPDYWR